MYNNRPAVRPAQPGQSTSSAPPRPPRPDLAARPAFHPNAVLPPARMPQNTAPHYNTNPIPQNAPGPRVNLRENVLPPARMPQNTAPHYNTNPIPPARPVHSTSNVLPPARMPQNTAPHYNTNPLPPPAAALPSARSQQRHR